MNKENLNKEIIKKLKHSDIIAIAASVATTFTYILTLDEIDTCMKNAMWKALKKYDDKRGCKFTTYFYKGMVMECLTQQKFYLNNRSNERYVHKNTPDPIDYNLRTEMLDLVMNCDDPDLMYNRFYKNMTVKELAEKMGVCGETVRMRIKKNLKKLKCNFI